MRRVAVLGVSVAVLWAAAITAWVVVWPANAVPRTEPAPVRYAPPAVVVDAGVEVEQAEVAAYVERITSDPRGWRTDLDHLTVRIVKPGDMGTERMPGIVGTAHFDQATAAISVEAWTTLGPKLAAAGGTLDDQRTWIVLHELGHLLTDDGDHTECPGPGQPAPLMRATTYGIGDCALNVWPHPAQSANTQISR